MKFLITGGAGFIGSCFVKRLLKSRPKDKILALDSLSYAGQQSRLQDLESHGNYQFVQADVCGKQDMEKAMKGVDVVFHFAAETHVDRSLLDARPFFETNVLGTQNLIQAALKEKIQRFVHVSTDEVYGSLKEGSFKESDPPHPANPYSISKAAAEWLVLNACRQEGLPAVITPGIQYIRPLPIPRKGDTSFVSNLLKGKKVPLYGDGTHIRDWLHVDDHCSAIEYVFEKGEQGGIYNVGGNHPLSNKALTIAILKELGLGEDLIEHVKDRKGHDWRYSLDDTKIKQLGWKHEIDFDQKFPETIGWYKENQEWLDEIRSKNKEFKTYYEKQYTHRVK